MDFSGIAGSTLGEIGGIPEAVDDALVYNKLTEEDGETASSEDAILADDAGMAADEFRSTVEVSSPP